MGIHFQSNQKVQGKGTLIAIGGSSNFISYGIRANVSFTLNEGNVSATGGKAKESSFGIYVGNNLTINNGTLKANGGVIQMIDSYGAYCSAGDVFFNGGIAIFKAYTNALSHQPIISSKKDITYWFNRQSSSSGGNRKRQHLSPYSYDVSHKYVKFLADQSSIDMAIALIGKTIYEVQQNVINTESGITSWLDAKLKAIVNTSDTEVTIKTIIESFSAAESGSLMNPSGKDGNFKFIVEATQNDLTTTSKTMEGIIKANLIQNNPPAKIEATLDEQLVLHLKNTGNATSQQINLTLSGPNANAFMLETSTIAPLAAGQSKRIAIKTVPYLGNGQYSAALNIHIGSSSPIKIEFFFKVTPVALEPESNTHTFNAQVINGSLQISGLSQKELLTVYSISGALIYKGITESDEVRVSLPQRGLYIISVNRESQKVMW